MQYASRFDEMGYRLQGGFIGRKGTATMDVLYFNSDTALLYVACRHHIDATCVSSARKT